MGDAARRLSSTSPPSSSHPPPKGSRSAPGLKARMTRNTRNNNNNNILSSLKRYVPIPQYYTHAILHNFCVLTKLTFKTGLLPIGILFVYSRPPLVVYFFVFTILIESNDLIPSRRLTASDRFYRFCLSFV